MKFLFSGVLASELMAAELMAAEAGAGQGGSPWQSIIMLVVFGLIFYFMLIRPQSKRAKEHKGMVEGLQKGDEVTTNGGLIGKITKVGESFITIKIADNVEVNLQKHAVSSALPKGTIKSI